MIGTLFDIRRFAVNDGPGIRTTIFFKGCPLNCVWCHNPESQEMLPERIYHPNRCITCGACVENCPQDGLSIENGKIVANRDVCIACSTCADNCYSEASEIIGQMYSVDEVMTEILKDAVFYELSGGGVTFSGGEPTMQGDFLKALVMECKEAGLHVAVDTCGQVKWDYLEEINPYVDLYLYDLKSMDPVKHKELTGVGLDLILENLKKLNESGKEIWVRCPVIPTINDDEDNLTAVANFVQPLKNVTQVTLLPYHPSAKAKYENLGREYLMDDSIQTPSETDMAKVLAQFDAYSLPVAIGG